MFALAEFSRKVQDNLLFDLEILQTVPGYSVDIFLKRVPRLINEPYTREMSIKIAKNVTEKGVVRLVKIAAGANI